MSKSAGQPSTSIGPTIRRFRFDQCKTAAGNFSLDTPSIDVAEHPVAGVHRRIISPADAILGRYRRLW
ncbi:MAG: hypothetical protein JWR51_4501 [Devosia sp.]|nr:hypothetical protein [Devosia sp.]